MIRFPCPYCAARLEIGESRAGRMMTCAFCKGQVEVPKPEAHRPRDEYELVDDAASLRGSATVGTLTQADIEKLEIEEKPRKKKRRPMMRWQLFIGGFGFPWTPGAVLRWLLIAIWAAVAGGLFYLAVSRGIQHPLGGADISHAIVALLAALGATIAGLACAGVAGIHGLTILLETTAGNDRMESWPNVGLFTEWIGQLWFIINAALLSAALGMGIHWLMPSLFTDRNATVGVTVFFVFPILLLCTLESDSPFLPVSAAVFASMGRKCVAWLAFYLQSACLLGAVLGLGYCLAPLRDHPPLAILLAALAFSAVVMIYFRLLGRLAFYCSEAPLDDELVEE